MLKKTIFGFILAACAILPTTGSKLSAALPAQSNDQLARINWNININTFGGYYQPCYYPPCYYYPYPPCAYPYPPSPYWAW